EASESSSQTSEEAEAEETQVFVAGFDKDMTEEAIREYFAKAAPIVKYEARGKGRARLTYSSASDAKNAVASCNGTTIEGNIRPLFVQIFTHGDLARSRVIYVGGFASGTEEPALREHFGTAGSIVDFKLLGNHSAFVTYSSNEEGVSAVASLNGKPMEGSDRFLDVRLKGSLKVAGEAEVLEEIKMDKKKKAKKSKVAHGVEKTQKIKKELPTENTVVVFGFDRGINMTVIKEHCGKAGSIVDSKRTRTCLLLTYSSVEEAATAVASLNGTTIQGSSRFIIVDHSKGVREKEELHEELVA
ncbi:unnamed protein product, partial [Polarella glacialis]